LTIISWTLSHINHLWLTSPRTAIIPYSFKVFLLSGLTLV
jgi:hypothetical protein